MGNPFNPHFNHLSKAFINRDQALKSDLQTFTSPYSEPLDLLTIKEDYRHTFSSQGRSIIDQALNQMTRATKGYAYAFQLLGYLVWRNSKSTITDELIVNVLQQYKEQLFHNVYLNIYQELSGKDREFVNAMADSKNDDVKFSFIQSSSSPR